MIDLEAVIGNGKETIIGIGACPNEGPEFFVRVIGEWDITVGYVHIQYIRANEDGWNIITTPLVALDSEKTTQQTDLIDMIPIATEEVHAHPTLPQLVEDLALAWAMSCANDWKADADLWPIQLEVQPVIDALKLATEGYDGSMSTDMLLRDAWDLASEETQKAAAQKVINFLMAR